MGLGKLGVISAVAWIGMAGVVGAEVIDTFDRPDSDQLGAAEKTGLRYVETTLRGVHANVARIEGKRLLLAGDAKAKPDVATGRVFIDGYDSADVTVSLRGEFRTDHASPSQGDQARNSLGILLRGRQDSQFGNGKAGDADAGYVTIEFFNNGQFFVRERKADGKLMPLGKRPAYTYRAGALGATLNGQPYDTNNDGMLGNGEPFTLSVAISGQTLKLSVNGQELAPLALSTARGAVNGVGLFKGRPSANPNVLSDVLIDDLALDPAPATQPARD